MTELTAQVLEALGRFANDGAHGPYWVPIVPVAAAVARAAEAMHDVEREYVQDMVAAGYSDVKPFDAFLAKLREAPDA